MVRNALGNTDEFLFHLIGLFVWETNAKVVSFYEKRGYTKIGKMFALSRTAE